MEKQPDIFTPDGYEMLDAPGEVAASMDRARYADPGLVTSIPSPSGLVCRKPKRAVTLRLDIDTLEWFQSLGKGYQTKINAILTSYKTVQGSHKAETN